MNGKGLAQISLVCMIIMSLVSNPIIFPMAHKQTDPFSINNNHNNLNQIAFAESDNNDNATADQNATVTDQQLKDEQQSDELEGETQADEQGGEDADQSQDQNKTEGEQQLEANQQSSDENNQNKTEGENQPEANQEGIDEIDNENNNEKATHEENQQDTNDVENAIENMTVAAEINIGAGNEEIKSIDSNIEVHTDNSTGDDAVSVTVDSKTESGPKVIIFNLNSTTIDVANLKYLHITYDGHSIAPATDVNAVLHPKSTDEPSYAIIVTQNGAQILVSIPHFSTHTITISKISKVIPPIPEFPLSVIAVFASIIALTIAMTRNRIRFSPPDFP